MNDVFPINGISFRSIAFLVVGAVLPAAITWAALRFLNSGRAAAIGLVILVLTLPVFVGLFFQLLSVKIRASSTALRIGGGLYVLEVPRSALRLDQIQVFDGPDRPSLSYRINGIGMPGLSLGWFQSTGGRKYFAASTQAAPLIVIPTTLDYDLWLSPSDSEAFLDELRKSPADTLPRQAGS